jgi:hypothetical protein
MSGVSNPLYYISLLTSEWQQKYKLKNFLASTIQPIADLNTCLLTMNAAFGLTTPPVGAQLDVLGQLIGVSRTLPFTPTQISTNTTEAILIAGPQFVTTTNVNGMFPSASVTIDTGGNAETVIITAVAPGGFSANFTKSHATNVPVSGIVTPVLNDTNYLILLKAKIAQNNWDGTILSLWNIWVQIFPGGRIIIQDNQNMTANIILTGSFSAIVLDMINAGLIVPQPEGVLYNYVYTTLPIFGADRNDQYVAGADIGHAA